MSTQSYTKKWGKSWRRTKKKKDDDDDDDDDEILEREGDKTGRKKRKVISVYEH